MNPVSGDRTGSTPLLEVRGLTVGVPAAGGARRLIVRGVDLTLDAGRTLGIIGESGCGKTTLARAILGLIPRDAGDMRLEGAAWPDRSRRRRRVRRRCMQVVFQDPLASLNPRHTIESIVGEGLVVHRLAGPAERRARVAAMLERVGLPSDCLRRYPHELSGGQRQRVAVARALIVSPRVVICDEPVSALDVSVRSQVINLLRDLQRDERLALLFIGHDLSVVRQVCDEVAVMYRGRFVEQGPVDAVLGRPRHPFTRLLIESVLEPTPGQALPSAPAGDATVPPPEAGCAFAPRCPLAIGRCWHERPGESAFVADGPRWSACFRAGEL